MKTKFLLLIFFYSFLRFSFAQNYSIPLGGVGYLACDKLEEAIVSKAKLVKGWDDYELNSHALKRVKFYSTRLYYNFALVQFKNSKETYVFCGISNNDIVLFEVMIETGESPGKMFKKYISPYKCDCN
ncbi:hypothetical protein [Pseudozobellia thermophila]|nr:hypothetical protein [Pseudozobellia thermophila]